VVKVRPQMQARLSTAGAGHVDERCSIEHREGLLALAIRLRPQIERPLWVSPVRPGREHDTTCARTHGLIDALNRFAATLNVPTLTDLGYENAGDGFRHPVKKPQGRELNLEQQTFNKVIRGIHAVAERANALLKVTFKALRRASLDPASITRITRAALVLLQLEHGRTT
jgi:hypothetical protein